MPEENDNTDPPQEGEQSPAEKSFSQSEMQRIATREKAEGKRAGVKAFLEELGLASTDELKAIIKQKQDAEDAEKSELQKAQKAAAEATSRAAAAEAAAAAERQAIKVERQLVAAGVPPAKVEKVRGMLALDSDVDDEGITAAVDELRQEFPELFQKADDTEDDGTTTTQGGRTGGPPPSDVGRQNRKVVKGKTAAEQASELLHQRHPALNK
jgi:hypothetical protein